MLRKTSLASQKNRIVIMNDAVKALGISKLALVKKDTGGIKTAKNLL